jgi:hypothetical protein
MSLGQVSVTPMPFTYSFERDPFRFVLLRAAGDVTLVMWADAMQQVIIDERFGVTVPIVLNAVDAAAPPPTAHAPMIAGAWRLLTPHSHGAIVASAGIPFDAAQQVERLSDARIRAFFDVTTALLWLRDPTARALTPAAAIVPCQAFGDAEVSAPRVDRTNDNSRRPVREDVT